jgi:hypothetical protein
VDVIYILLSLNLTRRKRVDITFELTTASAVISFSNVSVARPANVNGVARSGNFDLMTFGALSVPTFQVRVDCSIVTRDEHPT